MLRLVQNGMLGLDDTVSSFGLAVDAADTITVRHLLSHTSGLIDYNFRASFDWSLVWTTPEVLAWVTDKLRARFPSWGRVPILWNRIPVAVGDCGRRRSRICDRAPK